MPYAEHWYFVFGGTVTIGGAANDEIWQCGIRGIPGSATSYGQEDEVLTNLAAKMRGWFGDAANSMSSAARLTFLKLNQIGPNGDYVGNSHTLDLTPQVGGVTQNVPGILSVAFSWETGAQRGLASKGRIYPPAGLTQRAVMQITNAEKAVFGSAAQKLLQVVSAAPSGSPPENFVGVVPYVVSKGKEGVPTPGPQRPITGIRIGDIIDVQRRRKNAIRETYTHFDLLS